MGFRGIVEGKEKMIEMVQMEDGSCVPKEWCSFTNPLTSGGKSEVDDIDMKCFGDCGGECENCDLQKLFNEYAELSGQIK